MRNLLRSIAIVALLSATAVAQAPRPAPRPDPRQGTLPPPPSNPPVTPPAAVIAPPPAPPSPAPRGVPYPDPKPLEPATPRDEGGTGPRVPADYAGRAMLAVDPVFVNRITTATMVVADDVLAEPAGTRTAAAPSPTAAPATEYELRLRLVAFAMRDPESAGRKLARLVAANIPATMIVGGSRPATPLTDEELTAFIAARWSALAQAIGPF